MKKLFYLSNLITLCLIFCSVTVKAQAPSITAGPFDDTVCQGTTTMLHVVSTDPSALYVWQKFNGSTWDTVHNNSVYSGESNDTLTIVAGLGLAGATYRAFAYNDSGVSASSDTAILTVNPLPFTGIISGGSSVCVGATDTLSTTGTGGTWMSLHTAFATVSSAGIVTGVAAGADTIIYTATNACGTSTSTFPITVNSVFAGTITGASVVCTGNITAVTSTMSGGSWSSRNTAVATVSSTGTVMGVAPGVDTLYYIMANSCGTDTAMHTITVVNPSVGAITGASSVCVGSNVTLSDTTAGGMWTSSNASVATVSSTSGVVTGVATGTDTVMYSVIASCGIVTMSKVITVYTITVGALTGASSVCVGDTIRLSDTTAGGTWFSAHTSVATVTGVGDVIGVGAGVDSIYYAVTNSCGTTTLMHTVTVNTVSAGTISGASSVCVGSSTTLTSSVSGGSWMSGNTAVATVASSGSVHGVANGTDTVYYTVTNSCGADTAMHTITVGTSSVGAITGASTVCIGSSTTLADTSAGGSWSISNMSLATISSTGSVTGIASGLDTAMYTVNTSCGMVTVSFPITVYTIAIGAITGASSVCVGDSTMLADTSAGGTWSSSASSIAVVSATGLVHGIANGTATISYTVTTACGATTSTHTVVVGTLPLPAITGPSTVCQHSTITLSDSVTGGSWSSMNTALATVDASTGVVTGVASGLDTIVYTKTTACGAITTWFAVTVDTGVGAAPILGPGTVCTSSFVTLTNANAGGVWTISNSNATISTSGMVSGIAAGLDTVRYIFAGTCRTDTSYRVITIDTPISAGSITGATGVCVGSWVHFTATIAGGSWLSSNSGVATPDAAGFVTGRGQGTAIISYLFSNACGSFVATQSITVDRAASMITGLDSVGVGFTRALSDSVMGGMWSSSDTMFATVDTMGVVTGVAVGTATITYTVTNICGTTWAAKLIHVGLPPSAGGITGPDSVCQGSTITLADTISGGVWASMNTVAAGVTAGGVVSGIVGGVLDTITYTVTNGFGSGVAMHTVYVNTKPVITFGAVPSNMILGNMYTIPVTPAGGVWTSLTPANIAFISTTNFVPLKMLNTKLVYTATNTCGTTSDTILIKLAAAGVTNVNNAGDVAMDVYPNPNNGTFSLNISSLINESAHVVVTNMLGKSVQEFDMTTNKVNNVSLTQPAGVYFVTATTNHGRLATKITIAE